MTWGSPHFGGDSSKVAQHLTEGVVQVCGTNTACAALMIDGRVLALFSYTFMLLLKFIHTSVLYLLVLVLVLVLFFCFLSNFTIRFGVNLGFFVCCCFFVQLVRCRDLGRRRGGRRLLGSCLTSERGRHRALLQLQGLRSPQSRRQCRVLGRHGLLVP